MLIDGEEQYSDAQALTATEVSTNVIDHGVDGDIGLGVGEPVDVVIQTDVLADDTDGDETYTVTLQTDDDSAFGSPTQIGGTLTIARGTLAGVRFFIPLPPLKEFKRHSRLNYTLGGTSPSITLTAMLMLRRFVQNEAEYPDNSPITTPVGP